MKHFLATAIVAFLLISCAQNKYAVHPGAVDRTDSMAYDSLLVAQAAIDATRLLIQEGTFPTTEVPAFNKTEAAYNVARDAWLAYRAAKTGDGTELNADIALLTQAIVDMQAQQGKVTP